MQPSAEDLLARWREYLERPREFASALGELNDLRPVLEACTTPTLKKRAFLAHALAAVPGSRARELCIASLDDGRQAVCTAAAEALLGRGEVSPALKAKLLQLPVSAVTPAAFRLFELYLPDDAEIRECVVRLAADPECPLYKESFLAAFRRAPEGQLLSAIPEVLARPAGPLGIFEFRRSDEMDAAMLVAEHFPRSLSALRLMLDSSDAVVRKTGILALIHLRPEQRTEEAERLADSFAESEASFYHYLQCRWQERSWQEEPAARDADAALSDEEFAVIAAYLNAGHRARQSADSGHLVQSRMGLGLHELLKPHQYYRYVKDLALARRCVEINRGDRRRDLPRQRASGIHLISEADLRYLEECSPFATAIRELEFPGCGGVYQFSRVAIHASTALFYCEWYGGPLAAFGNLVVMQQVDAGWQPHSEHGLWRA